MSDPEADPEALAKAVMELRRIKSPFDFTDDVVCPVEQNVKDCESCKSPDKSHSE